MLIFNSYGVKTTKICGTTLNAFIKVSLLIGLKNKQKLKPKFTISFALMLEPYNIIN